MGKRRAAAHFFSSGTRKIFYEGLNPLISTTSVIENLNND